MQSASAIFGGGGGGVKAIQRGMAAMSSAQTTVDVTISNVNTGKTEIRPCGVRGDAAISAALGVTFQLVNATTLRLTRAATDGTPIYTAWELTEFN